MCGALHLLWNVNLQIPFIPIQLFIKYSIALFTKMFQISQNVVLIIILKISSDKPTFFFFDKYKLLNSKITILKLYIFILCPNDLILSFHLMRSILNKKMLC